VLAQDCEQLYAKLSDTLVSTVAMKFRDIALGISAQRKSLDRISRTL
jgi:hypothetical protein